MTDEPTIDITVMPDRGYAPGRDPPPPGPPEWARTRLRHHRYLLMRDVHRLWLAEMLDAEHPGYRLVSWTRPDRTLLVSAALHDNSVAAAVHLAAGSDRACQWGPAVAAAHRGRLLGRWVTAAALCRILEDHPRIAVVEAESAGGPAEAVQAHLGFRAGIPPTIGINGG